MITRTRTGLALAFTTCLHVAACETDPCGPRDALTCDAIYEPFVTFSFTDSVTGEAYCGDAVISYHSECDLTGEMSCTCQEGTMVAEGGYMSCHINPPEGETSTITVMVAGYEDFTTDVTLPYECHPSDHVDVLLVPL